MGRRERRSVLVAGKPEESRLIELVSSEGSMAPRCPTEGEPLAGSRRCAPRSAGSPKARSTTRLRTPSSCPLAEPAAALSARAARPPLSAYSPDGTLLAVGGHNEVLLHQADGSALVDRLIGASERIESLAFSPTERDSPSRRLAGALGRAADLDVAKRELERSCRRRTTRSSARAGRRTAA
jgi:hypothetical protein